MLSYWIYFLDEVGAVARAEKFYLANNAKALSIARGIADAGRGVELWYGETMLWRAYQTAPAHAPLD